MADNELNATRAGVGKTHRQPTAEELKKHLADHSKVLQGIRQSHAKTMNKVKTMQTKPLYVDRGA